MICDDCDTTIDVERTTCPFAEEIYEEEVEADLCPACYHERWMNT